MPTYEYECEACGKTFEVFQNISEDPVKVCALCGKKGKVKRLLGTGAGFLFKGSGFYSTDYRSDSYKQGAEAAKKSSTPSTDKKADKKSDSSTKGSATKKDS
jgi:putative FmdB family regulatory protein